MDGVGEGLGVGDGSGDGVGVGDGDGEGEGLGVGDGSGDGVGVGDGDGEGEGLGDGVGVVVVSTVKVTELLASAPSRLLLPAASENFELATEITPSALLLSVGVKVAV